MLIKRKYHEIDTTHGITYFYFYPELVNHNSALETEEETYDIIEVYNEGNPVTIDEIKQVDQIYFVTIVYNYVSGNMSFIGLSTPIRGFLSQKEAEEYAKNVNKCILNELPECEKLHIYSKGQREFHGAFVEAAINRVNEEI